MEISIGQSIYWSNNSKITETLKHIHKLGFDNVEIYCGHPFIEGWEKEDYLKKMESIKDILVDRKMHPTVHAPHYDINIASWNSKIRKNGIKQIKKAIKSAKILGAKKTVVHPGYVSSRKFSREKSFKKMMKSLKEIDRYAKRKNIKLGLENLGWNPKALCTTPYEIKETIKYNDLENTGITFDVAHANSIPNWDPIDFFKEISAYVTHIHISDNRGEDSHHPIGVGNIDYETLLEYIDRTGYNGKLTLEGWLPKKDYTDEFVRTSVKIIRNILNKL